ncbi:MAG: signal peptidase I [Clostridia bacterium]|nr:signal peptidase I [Clostridia bacterium]
MDLGFDPQFLDAKHRKGKFVANILLVFVAILAVLVIFWVSVFSFSKVSGDSMMYTVQNEDIVLCSTLGKYRRGDIVTASVSDDKVIIKRIIAVGGDRVVFRTTGDGLIPHNETVELYLDTGDGFTLVSEPYIMDGYMTEYGFSLQDTYDESFLYVGDIQSVTDEYIVTVPEGEYLLLGDNRDVSLDSRNYGLFTDDDILGKVAKIINKASIWYNIIDNVYMSEL